MPTVDDRKELFAKIAEKRKEISQLQSELNLINDKKEAAFEKKTELSKKISSLIDEIKKSREERNSLTQEVKKQKQAREGYNHSVKESVEQIKSFEKERDELLKKHKIGDPTKLMRQIAILDMKVETEPMSFEKEKKLMKQINSLKKQLNEVKALSPVMQKIHSLSGEIDKKKKVAQTSHRQVQTNAMKSQEKHEALIEASKEIDDIKKQEEESFKSFIEHKKRFNEINESLKIKLKELNELNQKSQENRNESRNVFEKKRKDTLEQKKLSVEEKIKKRMKLTTEDLLAFQGMDDKD